MAKKLFVLAMVVLASVVLSACSGDSKPQPVCRTDAKSGQTWVALEDSVSQNNPRGICQLKDDKSGKVVGQQAGEVSFAQYFAALADTAKKTANCYDKTGMGTSCVAENNK